MALYRSPMEKILEQQEENTVITNPKEPARTFFRKIAYTIRVGRINCKEYFAAATVKAGNPNPN